MVCIPCIVIPLVLWIFHKFIQPFILKFWNPWGQKNLQKIDGPPKGVSESDRQFQYVFKKIEGNKVVLFCKTTCNFCEKTKSLLEELAVPYTVDEIGERPDCKEIQDMLEKLTGARTVPRIFIDQKSVGGYSELYTLHNKGQLSSLLAEAGVNAKLGKKSD